VLAARQLLMLDRAAVLLLLLLLLLAVHLKAARLVRVVAGSSFLSFLLRLFLLRGVTTCADAATAAAGAAAIHSIAPLAVQQGLHPQLLLLPLAVAAAATTVVARWRQLGPVHAADQHEAVER
jgi:hypothetical protein